MSEPITIYQAVREHAWRSMTHERIRPTLAQPKVQLKLWSREEQILKEEEEQRSE